MQTGNSHIVKAHDLVAEDGSRQRGFFRDGNVAGASCCNNDFSDSIRLRYRTDNAAASFRMIIQRVNFANLSRGFRGKAGNQNRILSAPQHGVGDSDNLLRRFFRAVDDLRCALSELSVHIYLRITDIFKRLHLQFQKRVVNGNRATADRF